MGKYFAKLSKDLTREEKISLVGIEPMSSQQLEVLRQRFEQVKQKRMFLFNSFYQEMFDAGYDGRLTPSVRLGKSRQFRNLGIIPDITVFPSNWEYKISINGDYIPGMLNPDEEKKF